MTALPKPARRERKKPKPIARRVRPRRVRLRTGLRQTVHAPLGKLRELADDLQSLYVRHTSGWSCWACPSKRWETMQAAHIFAKSEYHAGRYFYDPKRAERSNLVCLCHACHKHYTHRPDGWLIYVTKRLGADTIDHLRVLCQVRYAPHDYALVALDYRSRLVQLLDLWKVQEQYDKLLERGRKLGVFR